MTLPPGTAALGWLFTLLSAGAAAGTDLAYRQPSAGATWVRMLSMTWAL
jgi:hypothetical protein